MRVAELFLALLSSFGSAHEGTFRPATGEEIRWSVNAHQTLIWDGTPYLPFGLRIGASEAEVAAAKAAGVKDVLVDCPPNPVLMKATVAALEREGLRYVISISSLAPAARGAVIEPQGNRFTGITAKKTLEFTILGAEEALVVLAVRRDNYVQSVQRVKSDNGRFRVEVAPPNDLEHVAMIYPIAASQEQLGAWETFDAHRDALLTSLKEARLGRGMRGILNPLGTVASTYGPRTFVPTNRLFRFELAAHLKETYRNPETCMRAWTMVGSEAKSFDQLAQIVPLWNGTRGLPSLWDPSDNKLYPSEIRRSTIWRDLETVLANAEARRADRLIRSIRRVADVPIVQDWVGWSPLYEGGPHGLNGIAAQTSGETLSALAETGSRAASSLMRWAVPGWFIASQVDFTRPLEPGGFEAVIEDLLSMGLRGAYLRTSDANLRTAIVQTATTKGADAALAQWSPQSVFFPESALNPASPIRLPGGKWWLPTPAAGNRIELGSFFHGYRVQEPGQSTVAIWSREGRLRVKLHLTDPKAAKFQTLDGSDPQARAVRDGVEVNLTEMPLLITGTAEIPIPELAINELIGRFEALILECDRRQVDASEERFLFGDYLNGYARNPGGNYNSMLEVLKKLSGRLARYSWIEAESTRSTTFSDILNLPGVSANRALGLRTQLATTAGEYSAEYSVQARTDIEVDCWIAARIARTDRERVRILIGGQEMAIEGEPTAGYGAGFAWHYFGKTRMARGQTSVVLKVRAPEGVDMAVDALVFFPGAFKPNGIVPPDAIAYPPFVLKK
ncbi:MAG TPA: hypothetical protein PLX06_07890 [Fimbriimonadaceae bacterium]|nr:hypothetical protein [Fimbriimonadaceae bacterium]